MRFGGLKMGTEDFLKITRATEKFSRACQNNTSEKDGYSFYRGHLFCTLDPNIIALRLLCSTYTGNFCSFLLEYVVDSAEIHYPKKMSSFIHEEEVSDSLCKLVESLSLFDLETSQVFFDMPITLRAGENPYSLCFYMADQRSPRGGENILFVATAANKYIDYVADANYYLCHQGTALCADWRKGVFAVLKAWKKGELSEDGLMEALAKVNLVKA